MNSHKQKQLQLHVYVEQPMTQLSNGKISCSPNGLQPIEFEWTSADGSEIQLDSTRSEAYGLTAGKYTVRVTDALGATALQTITISPVLQEAIIVSSYSTSPATSGSAMDGQVTAHGHGLENWNRYMWSNGTETTRPVLYDVRNGCYFISPLPINGKMPVFVQKCPPACVDVLGISDDL